MRPAMWLAQIMFATLKTKRPAKIMFGKMPITACNAAIRTAAAFPNAQTMLVTRKTKNGATMEPGNPRIIAQYAETGIYHAEQAAAVIFATQPQTNGAILMPGNLWIIAGIARILNALEPALIMHATLTRSNGAATEHGLLQIIAQYAETETLHAPQTARKMFATRHQIRGAPAANGPHRITATTALLRIATAQYNARKGNAMRPTKRTA